MTGRIFKIGFFDGESSEILEGDGIAYQGGLWLVAQWLEAPSEGYKVPARLICFDTMAHQKSSFFGVDYLVNDAIPKDVLDGRTTGGFEVIENPDLRFEIPRGIH